jgi:hypothetical protein
MPSLDPETAQWLENAERGLNPYAAVRFNDVIVISLIRDHEFNIVEQIGKNGHACWRGVNQSTIRPRRIRISAVLRDHKAVWAEEPRVQGEKFYIDEKIPRSQRTMSFYSKRNWSMPFNSQQTGEESVLTSCHGCNTQFESAFIIHPSLWKPAPSPQSDSRIGMQDSPRVFISHSSEDKDFARRLAQDLQTNALNTWLDEMILHTGDSIIGGISDGLKEADYLVVVLSAASARSQWVQMELNAALMQQMENKGIIILPARIDDTALPPLLRDRIYADFRRDYRLGLNSLLQVLLQEYNTAASTYGKVIQPGNSGAAVHLSNIKLADLRRLIVRRLSREEVGVLWYGILSSSMDDDMAGRDKQSCVVELLIKAQRSNLMPELIEELIRDYPDIGQVK